MEPQEGVPLIPEREPLPTRVQDTPTLPAAYEDVLDRGLAELGLDQDPGQDPAFRAAIDGHVRLLLAWTPHINLTAIRDPSAVATAHVLDSLSAVPWLRGRSPEGVLDIGSGGGYPALPLAAVLPDVTFALVEPIAKKARFLRTVVEATGLTDRVTVLSTRAEALAAEPGQRGAWSVVTARAVASTADLVELAFPLLRSGGCLLAWKRGDLTAELAAARRAIDALGGGSLMVRDVNVTGLADHRLAIATSTGAAAPAYPRDPAARRRRPW